jgi:hypothetical protein
MQKISYAVKFTSSNFQTVTCADREDTTRHHPETRMTPPDTFSTPPDTALNTADTARHIFNKNTIKAQKKNLERSLPLLRFSCVTGNGSYDPRPAPCGIIILRNPILFVKFFLRIETLSFLSIHSVFGILTRAFRRTPPQRNETEERSTIACLFFQFNHQ